MGVILKRIRVVVGIFILLMLFSPPAFGVDTKTAYTRDGINFISESRMNENIKFEYAKPGDYREVEVPLNTKVVGATEFADLNIENKVSSPEDKTIWTENSGKAPNQATIALSVTNLVSDGRPPLDVILAIDSSASLSSSDPQQLRVVAARTFIDNLDPNRDRVGVVLWNDTIVSTLPLTLDLQRATIDIHESGVSGNTCIWKALNASNFLLNGTNSSDIRAIILFSDGYDNCKESLDFRRLAAQIRNSGIKIYTIGLGESDIADLAAIGVYYSATDIQSLPSTFQDVATTVVGSLDNVQVKYLIPNGLDIVPTSPAQVNYLVPNYANIDSSGPSEKVDIVTENNSKMLIWNIGSMLPRETRSLSFRINSNVPGTYYVGSASAVAYTKRNGGEGIRNMSVVELDVKDIDRFVYVYYVLGATSGVIIGLVVILYRKSRRLGE